MVAGGSAARPNPDSYVGTGAKIWIFRGAFKAKGVECQRVRHEER